MSGGKGLARVDWVNKLRDSSMEEQRQMFKQLVQNVQQELIPVENWDSVLTRYNPQLTTEVK